MNCSQAKLLFSPYLDGAVSGVQMHAISGHLESCPDCQEEYRQLHQTQRLLAVAAGPRKVPKDAGLKLRLALSREIARSRQPMFEGMRIRFENTVKSFMIPATGGLALAVVVFLILMGSFGGTFEAYAGTDQTLMNTAPEFKQAAFGMSADSINDDSLVIEAYIGPTGRVDGYKILSDSSGTKDLSTEVKNMLIFTTFRPATYLGRPTFGRAVLSFSKVNVRG
jgi:hypothetical protein